MNTLITLSHEFRKPARHVELTPSIDEAIPRRKEWYQIKSRKLYLGGIGFIGAGLQLVYLNDLDVYLSAFMQCSLEETSDTERGVMWVTVRGNSRRGRLQLSSLKLGCWGDFRAGDFIFGYVHLVDNGVWPLDSTYTEVKATVHCNPKPRKWVKAPLLLPPDLEAGRYRILDFTEDTPQVWAARLVFDYTHNRPGFVDPRTFGVTKAIPTHSISEYLGAFLDTDKPPYVEIQADGKQDSFTFTLHLQKEGESDDSYSKLK